MIRRAVDELAREGRRRLALIACHMNQRASALHEAWRAALIERELEPIDEWFRVDLNPSAAGSGWEHVRDIRSARREAPDGLVIADDMMPEDAAEALRKLRIDVPDKLKVCALNSRGVLPRTHLPVTHLEFAPDLAAERTVDMLHRLITGEAVEEARGKLPVSIVDPDAPRTKRNATPSEPRPRPVAPTKRRLRRDKHDTRSTQAGRLSACCRGRSGCRARRGPGSAPSRVPAG